MTESGKAADSQYFYMILAKEGLNDWNVAITPGGPWCSIEQKKIFVRVTDTIAMFLHEVAHAKVGVREDDPTGHDAIWADTYTTLVSIYMRFNDGIGSLLQRGAYWVEEPTSGKAAEPQLGTCTYWNHPDHAHAQDYKCVDWKPIGGKVALNEMDEVCSRCGRRRGEHYETACPTGEVLRGPHPTNRFTLAVAASGGKAVERCPNPKCEGGMVYSHGKVLLCPWPGHSAPAVPKTERCQKIELRELAGFIDAVEDVVRSAREHFGIGDPAPAVPSSPAPSAREFAEATDNDLALGSLSVCQFAEAYHAHASAQLRAELDGARETAKTMIVAQLEKVAGLRAEVERLRETLKWYAEKDNYQPRNGSDDVVYTLLDIDFGAKARAALDSAQPATGKVVMPNDGNNISRSKYAGPGAASDENTQPAQERKEP